MKDEKITALISAFRSETSAGAITPESLGDLLQKIVDAIPDNSTRVLYSDPFIQHHTIEAELVDSQLFIRGNIEQILKEGNLPYLFRYTKKVCRYIDKETGHSYPTLDRKGWHTFFRHGKVAVDHDGSVMFYGSHDGFIDHNIKGSSPKLLFNKITYKIDPETKRCTKVLAPYGRKMVDCTKGRRFKFAIGFAPPQVSTKFDFSTLVTNLAVFRVLIYTEPWNRQAFIKFSL